jgi:hypothetical protein
MDDNFGVQLGVANVGPIAETRPSLARYSSQGARIEALYGHNYAADDVETGGGLCSALYDVIATNYAVVAQTQGPISVH